MSVGEFDYSSFEYTFLEESSEESDLHLKSEFSESTYYTTDSFHTRVPNERPCEPIDTRENPPMRRQDKNPG